MAGASLLALIDDIATILDDVAVLTKVAAQKTAGVVGDDLALNAQQVAGVRAERELPVVWAVAVGSLKNKLILVPAALVISALLPVVVVPLLMLGGLYLCYEGVEKLSHKWAHTRSHGGSSRVTETANEGLVPEAEKIKGAIRTDFVLSAEIVVIALGAVANASFATQVFVLASVGVLMTVGVYGTVAAIVKLDDLGLHLLTRGSHLAQAVGRGLLMTAPRLMKALTVIGTAAMFIVGGSILTHGLPSIHQLLEHIAAAAGNGSMVGNIVQGTVVLFLEILVGVIAGALALGSTRIVTTLRSSAGFDKSNRQP